MKTKFQFFLNQSHWTVATNNTDDPDTALGALIDFVFSNIQREGFTIYRTA